MASTVSRLIHKRLAKGRGMKRIAVSSAGLLTLLIACTVGPDYRRPSAPVPTAYKELAGWKPATPMDGIERGPWWSIYHDATLDALERQIDIGNQTLAAAYANYMQANALVQEAQAQLFPFLTASASDIRSGGGNQAVVVQPTGAGTGVGLTGKNTKKTFAVTFYTVQGQANWVLDIWGEIRRTIESRAAGAQFSAAQVANARLAAQAELATAYFNLRAADALQDLLNQTVDTYRQALRITENEYKAGYVSRLDVETALTELRSTEAQAVAVAQQRAQFEHAIAVLIGKPPAELSLAHGQLASVVPVVPPDVPSSLLERRPDIAAAERQMQEANALVGASIAALYPNITLTGSYGYTGIPPLAQLFALRNEIWSLGVNGTQPIFEGGLLVAQVAANRAAYLAAVANYRQTVLTAFQQVEDALVALRVLEQEAKVQQEAVAAAQRNYQLALNEYKAGTVIYTTVLTDQQLLLSNQVTLLTIQQNRLLESVALIEALGGGWTVADMPSIQDVRRQNGLLNIGW